MTLMDIPEGHLSACVQDINDEELKSHLDFMAKHHQGFLRLVGPPGRGKTWAACACLNEFYKINKPPKFARFFSLIDIYLRYSNVIANEGNIYRCIEPALDIELIVLDDLGTRRPPDAFKDVFQYLLDTRLAKKDYGTIITSNLNASQAQDWFGDAIVSRLQSGPQIVFDGNDRRKFNQEKRDSTCLQINQ